MSEDASSYMGEDEILSDIKNLKTRGASNIVLEFSDHIGAYGGMEWCFDMIETDEQYRRRLEAEEHQRKVQAALTKNKQKSILAKREEDKALYEKLKKEFGE